MKRLGKEFKTELGAITRIGEDNLELLELLKDNGIKELVITALGNSISTGFSFCDENKPLLDRNVLLETMCEEYGIDLHKYYFARSENNSDQNIFNWIINNYTEKEMNRMNRRDYRKESNKDLLTEEKIEEYYGEDKASDVHIQDILFNTVDDTSNIVIYNGLTGSFLDNVTRGGKHKLTNGIHKDMSYVESILGLIQNFNRENGSNTEVYLCGVPRVLNTGIQESFMNKKLKTVSNRYANTSYVDNISRHVLYKGDTKVDLHYDKLEYLRLTHLILKKVLDNYLIKDSLIKLDRDMYKYNKKLEMLDKQATYDLTMAIIADSHINYPGTNDLDYLKEVRRYLLERYCYDFFAMDKQAIKDCALKLHK